MDFGLDNEPLIDPEVKAFVFSLVSALGGPSGGDDGRYVLGDDALAVLKDIKRWIRLYDEKTNRHDVARLLAEANLVKGDLLEILALWPDDATEHLFKAKLALQCVDLLTQLTWPVERDGTNATANHFLHNPYLKSAQASYKRAILHHDNTKILRTAARISLPAMAQCQRERSPRDESILKIVLYFLRNVVMITEVEGAAIEEDDNEISRSATIDAFYRQDIFDVLLTICSSITEDFQGHDAEALEVLFHLLKGVDAERLFMEKDELISANTRDFKALVNKERAMLAAYARNQPSRHNRFGTMLWVKAGSDGYSTVSGQKALKSLEVSLHEMDKTKKWKKPRTGKRLEQSDLAEFDTNVPLTASARRHLRDFVEKFLDSSFNPLFASIRRSIERETDAILEIHPRQYFYLISWFLRAECARRARNAAAKTVSASSTNEEVESFALVASVLNQETFVLLGRRMQKGQDEKNWQDLNAAMKCFTQILLTVQEMSESNLEDDQEISENILSRIFYEQTTHERIISILHTFNNQGFGYLNACTELSHVFLRLLERYSKQNVDMQVRSRRRARKKKLNVAVSQGIDDTGDAAEDREIEADDIAEAQRTSSDRKFDFSKFAAKLINQASVNSFAAFLRYYKDLNVEQLKRAHRFFYRVAFKMESAVFLFRMDIISLLNTLVKGPEGLDLENPMFKEWEELVRQIFKRLLRMFQERPAFAVEILFSKIPSTMYYLEHGYDRIPPKKVWRVPAELEVKSGMDEEQRFGVAVSILINQTKSDLLAWIKSVLSKAAEERKAWEDEISARQEIAQQNLDVEPANDNPVPTTEPVEAPAILVTPNNLERTKAMSRDKYVRLLLTLLGWHNLSGEDTTYCLIPSSLSSAKLSEQVAQINNLEYEPPTYNDNKSAEDFVRTKTTADALGRRAQAATTGDDQRSSSDSEGDSTDEALFPPGGPTMRRSSTSPPRRGPKRNRNKHAPDEFLDERVLEERRAARQQAQAEKERRVKSELYVRDSDDESDEERDKAFFELEEERRRRKAMGIGLGIMGVETPVERQAGKSAGSGKRKRLLDADDSAKVDADGDASEREDDGHRHHSHLERKKMRRWLSGDAGTGSESESDATASDSDSIGVAARKTAMASSNADSEEDTDTGTPPSSQRPSSGHAEEHVILGARSLQRKIFDDDDSDHDAGTGDAGSDKENTGVEMLQPAFARRRVRAGFIVESDSE